MGLRVFRMHHAKYGFSRLGASISRMKQPSLLSLHDPPYVHAHIALERQAVVDPCPLIFLLVVVVGREVLLTSVSCLLHLNLVVIRLPGVQVFCYPSFYGLQLSLWYCRSGG